MSGARAAQRSSVDGQLAASVAVLIYLNTLPNGFVRSARSRPLLLLAAERWAAPRAGV